MKNVLKIFLLVVLLNIAAKATAGNNGILNPGTPADNGNNHDSTIGIKSNIIIFQIITTPALPANNSNGSLKKAGKAARTSYSHTSLDSILYKNKGI